MSRADCADLADAAPRSSTSLTTSRKPLRPSRESGGAMPPRETGEVRALSSWSRALDAAGGCVVRSGNAPQDCGTAAVRRAAFGPRIDVGARRHAAGRRGRAFARAAERAELAASRPAGWAAAAARPDAVRCASWRTVSASTLRMASSSARRSRVISASDSGGSMLRNCATKAARARSYRAPGALRRSRCRARRRRGR